MKVPASGEKPKNILDLLSNNEAVKVNTKSSQVKAEDSASQPVITRNIDEQKATSVKFGLAKYILEELDPKKVTEARAAKLADIKARIESGTYLDSVNPEKLAEKLLEESQLENLIVGRAASNE